MKLLIPVTDTEAVYRPVKRQAWAAADLNVCLLDNATKGAEHRLPVPRTGIR